ncbi:hypothetical protein AZE42_09509 [Rhizopogon vesiculosus]|uniref:Uncharacterized protein n=1 Tax=Rhizopogon vesiculosus TaxID=180088 RepID=A0A1J8QDU7_9AGAM|nr:hypothetical protein AZE42_09509 [Rhizopogon vesiculosus]
MVLSQRADSIGSYADQNLRQPYGWLCKAEFTFRLP